MAEPLTNEEVLDHAHRWARLYCNPKFRARMDTVLEDLSEDDQRRVYLCGQRIVGGLPEKVLSPTIKERKPNDNNKRKQRRKAAA
jgi:hypothetical protein